MHPMYWKIHEVSGVEPASVYQWRKSLHPTAVVTDSYVIKIGSCSPAMRLGVYAGTGTGVCYCTETTGM